MKKKSIDVQKFGGVESLGNAKLAAPDSLEGHTHEFNSIETQSQTNLEADKGEGDVAVIRCFRFGINPETWNQRPPSKQDLFNIHHKGIEMALWKDGLKAVIDIQPRVVVGKKSYTIFVVARPQRGISLNEMPQTLTEIAHG